MVKCWIGAGETRDNAYLRAECERLWLAKLIQANQCRCPASEANVQAIVKNIHKSKFLVIIESTQ
jgi:hypothetical protein